MKEQILLIGGTGGLGSALKDEIIILHNHYVSYVGSALCNVTSYTAVEHTINQCKPTVIVNLVTVNVDARLINHSQQDIERLINVNVLGGTNVLKASMNYFNKVGGGRYVYVSSVLAQRPIIGVSLYAASKAYNECLVQAVALEHAKKRISANVVRLGYFDKGMIEKVPAKVGEKLLERIPTGELGTADQLANAIEFFITTPYATGTILDLSGGLHV